MAFLCILNLKAQLEQLRTGISLANIFILGSQGFIGNQLCHYLSDKGHIITGCDIVEASPTYYAYHKVNILSPDFEGLFTGNNFNVCINASGSGNVGYSMLHPQSDFDVNANAVSRALDALRKQNSACRFLHISSAAVYGNPLQLPVVESAQADPLSPYGFHKLISELICKEYFDIYKIPVAIVRPFSVFGNGLRKQLLWDMCQKLKNADEVKLFGTGNETRDFIHITDFVKAIDCIINKSAFELDVYNIASGTPVSIKTVAGIFEKKIPGKTIGFSGEMKPGDPNQWQADISAIKKIGFAPEACFEKSVSDYIEWESKINTTL